MLAVLTVDRGATNLAVLPGAAREPAGDLVLCDVAREAAHTVLADLEASGLTERGSIAAQQVDLSLSTRCRPGRGARSRVAGGRAGLGGGAGPG